MTQESLEQLWKTYQDAWADVTAEERERLLRASVTEDVVFTSPSAHGRGLSELVTHVTEFQQQFPGAYFRNEQLIEQNDQLLSSWTMFNGDDSVFAKGQSYARISEKGLLAHLAGFWKL